MNIISDAPVELLISPWATTFFDLVGSAQEELLVASPFLSHEPLNKIVKVVGSKRPLINVDIITNLAVDSLLSGSLDVAALLHLAQSIPNSTIRRYKK